MSNPRAINIAVLQWWNPTQIRPTCFTVWPKRLSEASYVLPTGAVRLRCCRRKFLSP